MRNIQLEVTKQLQAGKILQCDKTRVSIGKRHITIGPYRTAVPSNQKYAMFLDGKGGNNDRVTFSLAIEAAQYLIDYVGRDIAWKMLPPAIKNRS
jgi:hypothetical protein